MGEAKFYEGYSRWNEEEDRYETWDEAVQRVMDMHRGYYKDIMNDELQLLIDEAEKSYIEKRVTGAQRALQFGGDQILKKHLRLYNCLSSYADRPAFFGELFFSLLCGAGVGFSVQKHHIAKLPKVIQRKGQAKIHAIEDSIEGWATSMDVLLSSYFEDGGKHPEYQGRRPYFDLTQIRPQGAFISGGFKAPGPEPLRRCLDKVEHLLQGIVLSERNYLKPIEVYDICMHIADAVLSGGVRRSATICLFSPTDEEMLSAKTGNWITENPQRARSNNSAMIVRNKVTKEQFGDIMGFIKEYGEPGFVFTESTEHTYNPCVEISKKPVFIDKDGKEHSGFQGCNLTEINGGSLKTREGFLHACKSAAILGTLQAGYTNFKFLGEISEKIFRREALLGVSITGWMNNPELLFDEDLLKEGAELVKKTNRIVAKLIGINPAARTTCTKPAGNVSVLLGTSSGVHGDHAPRYIRNMQMNKEQEVAQILKTTNPYMIEDSVWSSGNTDYIISFPIIAPKGSLFKKDLYGVNLLEKVKFIQNTWVEAGTDESLCVDPTLRHNVSNTVQVEPDGWDKVEEYLFENRNSFAGVSLISTSGDKAYNQAPFIEILTEKELVKKYGVAAFFASGLIVDAPVNLWTACHDAQRLNGTAPFGEQKDISAEWIRRFHKFADNYFKGDMEKASFCLKDVHLLHRWTKIQQNMNPVTFDKELKKRVYTDIDQTGAIACSGPEGCEIDFDEPEDM